jgi:hypothetical protein
MSEITADIVSNGISQCWRDIDALCKQALREEKRYAFTFESRREVKQWSIILHFSVLYKELLPGQPAPAGWTLIDPFTPDPN